MNLPLLFAGKYFFSSKVRNTIHIISRISQLGIAVGAFALIVVLSVFNGFEKVILSLYNSFDSDIRITIEEGKYFSFSENQRLRLRSLPGLRGISPIIEEVAGITYMGNLNYAMLKGIEPEYLETTGIDSMMVAGQPILTNEGYNYAIIGAGVAGKLGLNFFDMPQPFTVYYPNEGNPGKMMLNPNDVFNMLRIAPAGVFSIQQDFDNKYMLVPLAFMNELTGKSNHCTAIEMNFVSGTDLAKIKELTKEIMGTGFLVQDRKDQHQWLYRIFRIEGLMVFLILALIVFVAGFNLIGSLLMLSMEKKKDMMVLKTLGAENTTVRKIFYLEGAMLSVSSALIGILLGTLLCWFQMKYGMIKISQGSTFVIDAFPVAFKVLDFIWVFITVLVIGFFSSWLPAQTVTKELSISDLHK